VPITARIGQSFMVHMQAIVRSQICTSLCMFPLLNSRLALFVICLFWLFSVHMCILLFLLFDLSFVASPSVLWYCWLGLLTCKNRRPYNLYCVGADVKPCSIHQFGCFWFSCFRIRHRLGWVSRQIHTLVSQLDFYSPNWRHKISECEQRISFLSM